MSRPCAGTVRGACRQAALVLLPWCLGCCLVGCDLGAARRACVDDGDCREGEVCYFDGRCATRGAAQRSGATLARECRVDGDGVVRGCAEGATCRLGACDGPPEFDGALSAVSAGPTSLLVRWEAADDHTPADELDYLLYVAASEGGQDLSTPTEVVTGETSARIGGLDTNTPYWVVVRARDEYGQHDDNVVEVRGVPGCVDYPTQIQPLFDARCVECHGPERAYRELRLDSWEHLGEGSRFRAAVVACRPDLSPLFAKATTVQPPVDHLFPDDRPPLATEEVEVLEQWIAQGAVASCPRPLDRCDDMSAPVFAGLESASYVYPSRAELCWSDATDDTTAAADMVYEVYEATEPGRQDFDARPLLDTAPGQTCITLDGRVPDERYCWVVRARDRAGNRDDNVVEQCVHYPVLDCVDYEEVVQPLFDRRCIQCHGGPAPAAGLSLERWSGALVGGRRGPAVAACDPADSLLYRKVWVGAPADGRRMPLDGPPFLTDRQVAALHEWIAQGARASCDDLDPCIDGPEPELPALGGGT